MSSESIIKETIEENYKLFDSIEKHQNDENYQNELKKEYEKLQNYLSDSYEESVGKHLKKIDKEYKKELKNCNNNIKIKRYQTSEEISFDSLFSITSGIKNISEDISDSYFYGGSIVKMGLKLILNILITIPFMIILIIIKLIGLFK